MGLFDAVDEGNSLVDSHGFQHVFNLRPRVEQDHLRPIALERAGARHKHAHPERSYEVQAGNVYQGRPPAGSRIAVEFHVDGVLPGNVKPANEREVSNPLVQLDHVQLNHVLSFRRSPQPTRHISSVCGWSPRNCMTSQTIRSPDSRTIPGAAASRSRRRPAPNISPAALVASLKPSV